MGPKHQQIIWKLIVFVTLAGPFVFFSSYRQPWHMQGGLPLLVQEALYPFEFVWLKSTRILGSIWREYFFLHNAAQENARLKSEVALLKTKLLDYNHQVGESQRLRKLLGFSEQYGKEVVIAEVVGQQGHRDYPSIRIAKGSRDGLEMGMPVIAPRGVIGRVIRVGLKFSDVQILTDSNFNLDVTVERSRIRGVLRGISDNRGRLQLHRRADIRIGDTIVTSGIVGAFPRGLPVGRVIRVSYESDNVSQFVTVQPWVDYYSLEEVMILKVHDEYVSQILEMSGPEWFETTVGVEQEP